MRKNLIGAVIFLVAVLGLLLGLCVALEHRRVDVPQTPSDTNGTTSQETAAPESSEPPQPTSDATESTTTAATEETTVPSVTETPTTTEVPTAAPVEPDPTDTSATESTGREDEFPLA